MAQVDHATGEVLGFAIERIMERGAHNVQLIPTITKKNRPGHILLIDTEAGREAAIADFLVLELKVTGYHRVDTTHVFHRVSYLKKMLKIKTNGRHETFPCEVKLIGDPAEPLSMDVEHDFLIRIQKLIQEKLNSRVPLSELRTMIESRLRQSINSPDDITIEL